MKSFSNFENVVVETELVMKIFLGFESKIYGLVYIWKRVYGEKNLLLCYYDDDNSRQEIETIGQTRERIIFLDE